MGVPQWVNWGTNTPICQDRIIADNYDALTSDRPYRRGLSPNEAIEYIMASGGSLFDYDLVKEFINKIIPYPIGTLVRLSNGCIASVESVTPDLPLRPKVRIVRGNHEYRIDDTIDLFITIIL